MTRRQRRTRFATVCVGSSSSDLQLRWLYGALLEPQDPGATPGSGNWQVNSPRGQSRGLLRTVTYAPDVALELVVVGACPVGACPASSWASRSALSEAS
jgi:hypothetical protein